MALTILQREIEGVLGKKLKLKINDNRSTMLSVKWEPDCTKVSLHRMFLSAPQNVMQELACYLGRKSKMTPSIKAFIEDNLKQLDYSHLLDSSKMSVQGKLYNLKQIYDILNRDYFSGALNLHITWFGTHNQKSRSRVTFGLYQDQLRLIKIHRILDSSAFPEYIVSFVIYHEMLHHVCRSYFDEKGLHRVHSKEFKSREKQFDHYALAQKWIREHRNIFFD